MANQQAYLGQSGAVYYDDAAIGLYPAPNDTLATGGALCAQMYITEDPDDPLDGTNKKYVDKVSLFELNADKDIQPKARVAADGGGFYHIIPTVRTSGLLTIGVTYKILDWITDDDFVNVGGANVDGTVFVATGTTPTHWAHSSKLVGYQNLGSSTLPWDKIYVTNVYAVGVNISGLTVSLPVITDGSKNLVSIAYTGATSFRKNLGLETDDSPTFNQVNATTLHTTTILADHVGEHGSAHGVVFDNDLLRVGKLSIDHIAEATSSHAVVFDNDLSRAGKLSIDHIAEATNAHTITFDNTVTIGSLEGILKAATGVVAAATIGVSLSYSAPTLDAIQDIRTIATPQFAAVRLSDLDASHYLALIFNQAEAAASRILNFILGAADRTITLSGSPTLADWFDQAVKEASGPSFDHLHLTIVGGTAPLNITSTTMCSNLNADLLDGMHASSFWGGGASVDHALLSTIHSDTLAASAVLGDIIHGNVTPVWAKLAGNTTTTKKFLVQTGTGLISALPAWDTIVDGDVPATHSGSAHHAAVTLATAGDTLLGLSGQALDLDTQAANLLFAGPVSGAVAAPTFRSLVDADFPATLNPTLAGLGATPIVTSYAGPHAFGAATSSYIQYKFAGIFTSSIALVVGVFCQSFLTPGGVNGSAYGVYYQPGLYMVAGQTHPVYASVYITAPSITSASGATITEATTLRILGAPTAGVSNYAFNVVAGASRFGALTASLPIVTDSDKVLASLAYTGATSFRKNLGLETDDSPTFNQGDFTTLHTTTILADHIGEHGSAHTIVFDNSVTLGALSGVLKATAGLVAGSAVHSDLGSIGANDHHNAITLDTNADTLLSLSTQALGLDTQAMNLGFFGPVSGAAAVPTFRAMVAADLGSALSPTFDQGNFTTLHTTTILADHIGEHGSAHTVVFDNTVTLPASTIVPDAGTIGLGSGKGLIQFDDETIDTISFLNCNVGIGTTPLQRLDVASITTATAFRVGPSGNSAFGIHLWYDQNTGCVSYDQQYNNDAGNIYFRTKVRGTPINALTILGSGNVGIGTTAPLRALDINEASGNCLRLIYNDADGSAASYADFLVGSAGDLTITSPAAKTVYFSPTVYDDMQFPVSDAKVTPNNLLPSWETFTANTSEYAFAVDEEVDTQANEIPHWWKQGTAGNAHIHITTKAVPAGQQYAKFTITFAYADTNEVWVEAPLTAELTIPISTTALTNFYLDLGDLTLTNYLVGAQIRCRIKRIAATGGTEYVGDIFVTQVGIHLEKDTLGSRQEIVK